MRVIAVVIGIVVAAVGGVIAYRALFVETGTIAVFSTEGVTTYSNTTQVVVGIVLLVLGAGAAFVASIKRNR